MFEPQNPTTPPTPVGGPFTPPVNPSPFVSEPAGTVPAAAPDPSAMRTMPSRFLPGEPGAPKKSRAWVVVLAPARRFAPNGPFTRSVFADAIHTIAGTRPALVA